MEQTEGKVWWAMSAVFNRSMKMKAVLDSMGVDCFVPMRFRAVCCGRRQVRTLVPAIHNLIFVYSTARQIKALKDSYPYLQYLVCRTDGKAYPIVVPDRQMSHFIAVAGTADEQLIYLSPEDVNLRAGDRVRIRGGAFEGVEGVFVRVKGARDRRVVVSIEGVAAVATATIPVELVEKIRA